MRQQEQKGVLVLAYKGYGIDLGTKNIKIYKEKQGIVIDQKNTIAVNDIGKVLMEPMRCMRRRRRRLQLPFR